MEHQHPNSIRLPHQQEQEKLRENNDQIHETDTECDNNEKESENRPLDLRLNKNPINLTISQQNNTHHEENQSSQLIWADDDNSIISISSDDSDTEQGTTINSKQHTKYMEVLMISRSIKLEKECQ